MVTKRVGQADYEALLIGAPPAQGSLLADGTRDPPIVRTGKPGRPKGRRNNATYARRANLDVLGELMLRQRIDLALADPVDEAKRIVARIYSLPDGADPNTIVERKVSPTGEVTQIVTFADVVTAMTVDVMKLREKARDGASAFVLKKKPTEIDISERKITEAHIYVEDRRQLPGAMQGMIEGTAEVIADAAVADGPAGTKP